MAKVDRKKVTDGLRACAKNTYGACEECPYRDGGGFDVCWSTLCAEAVELLEEGKG